jgi:hypothetical protein
MLRSIRCYVWFFCIAGVLCSVTPLIAQIDRGTIQGLVKDASGAVIPGAKVQIIQIATNSIYDLVTNGEGLYIAPNLPVATYKVVIQAPGFSTFSREPVEVRAHVQVRVDAVLQVGMPTQVTTVTAEAPLLDVSATSNSTGLQSEAVEKLPLIVSVYISAPSPIFCRTCPGSRRAIRSYLAQAGVQQEIRRSLLTGELQASGALLEAVYQRYRL